MPEYELTYFNSRALAEPIRLLLSHVGADWKDNRIPDAGPAVVVPDDNKSRCLFSLVPLLEFSGNRLSQSAAILRYLGRKYNLAGKDELESAHVDEIGDAGAEIFMAFRPILNEKDESKRPDMIKAAAVLVKDRFLKTFDALLVKNGGYLVGNSLTWADIVVAHMVDQVQRVFSVQLLDDDLPALKMFSDNVFNAKGIKEWVAKRPETFY